MRMILKVLSILWASPNSVIGLIVGAAGLVSGGKMQFRRGVFEFYGGATSFLLRKFAGPSTIAMTLGHTILGRDDNGLEIARDHEHVHVSQYERWGPLFIPAYLLSSLYLWVVKRDPYRDNPFEVEAYAKADIKSSSNGDDEDSDGVTIL